MKMFGTNGIRGVANGYLDCTLSTQVGKAIATVLGPGPIALAMDTRISSEMIRCSVSAGLMSMGIDVIFLGMVPTPALQYYVKTHDDVTGGVMITASHNPPEFNGIKCVSADGTECSHEEESAIEDAYDTEIQTVPWDKVGTMRTYNSAGEDYIESIISKVDADLIRSAKLTAVVDCANGASVNTTPLLLSRLGVRAIAINATPDGMFPGHYSEPTEDNLGDLKRLTAETGADLGFAHDGDADRGVFVTEKGTYVPGDKALALFGKNIVLSKGKGLVVSTVATSKVVEDAVTAVGGTVCYTAVGSPIVARKMIEADGVFGGEENGGLIFADHQFCRDGAMALARMLESVAKYGSLEAQVSQLPKYCTIKEGAYCDEKFKTKITEVIAANHSDLKLNRLDGLRIDYDDGWVLLRPSGTEPKYRIYSESKDPEVAKKRAAEFKEEFERELKKLS